MLLVAKPGNEARVIEICKKWELDAEIIGRVTDTGRWVVRATPGYDPLAPSPIAPAPVMVCDLPVDLLTDAAPKYDRPRRDDPSLPARRAFDAASIADPPSWGDELLRLAGSPNLGSRRWVWRQYDHIVRGGTHVRPGGDAAVVRVPCTDKVEKILAFSSDCNGRLCELDPFQGAAMAVAEVCRNLACVGAEAIGITDCLNFGNPERPEIMQQFALCIDGMAAACKALEVPIVSGNVSLYNETDGRAILPTPTVAAVGLVRDWSHVARHGFAAAGLEVLLLGAAHGGPLGGSEYLVQKTGKVQGQPPALDLAAEARLQRLLLELLRAEGGPRLASAHDVSDGGLAIALAECCAATDDDASMVGATIEVPAEGTLAEALFGEAPTRVVVSVTPAHRAEVERRAAAVGVPVLRLGQTGGPRLLLRRGGATLVDVQLERIRDARERCLEPIVGS
jgi:phosphoribosylformylglycinamidine synthase